MGYHLVIKILKLFILQIFYKHSCVVCVVSNILPHAQNHHGNMFSETGSENGFPRSGHPGAVQQTKKTFMFPNTGSENEFSRSGDPGWHKVYIYIYYNIIYIYMQ